MPEIVELQAWCAKARTLLSRGKQNKERNIETRSEQLAAQLEKMKAIPALEQKYQEGVARAERLNVRVQALVKKKEQGGLRQKEYNKEVIELQGGIGRLKEELRGALAKHAESQPSSPRPTQPSSSIPTPPPFVPTPPPFIPTPPPMGNGDAPMVKGTSKAPPRRPVTGSAGGQAGKSGGVVPVVPEAPKVLPLRDLAVLLPSDSITGGRTKDREAFAAMGHLSTISDSGLQAVPNEQAGVNTSYQFKAPGEGDKAKTVALFKPSFAPNISEKAAPCFNNPRVGVLERREVATSAWNEFCGGLGDYPLTIPMQAGDQSGSLMAWRAGAEEFSKFSPTFSEYTFTGEYAEAGISDYAAALKKIPEGISELEVGGKIVRVSVDGRPDPLNEGKPTARLTEVAAEYERILATKEREKQELVAKITPNDAQDLMSLHVATLQLDVENANNLMFTTEGDQVKPIAIDGGLSAPDKIVGADAKDPCWSTWPQANQPWTDEQTAKFAQIDVAGASKKLTSFLDGSPVGGLEPKSVNRMMAATQLLKIASVAKLTPKLTWTFVKTYLEGWVEESEKTVAAGELTGKKVDFLTDFTARAEKGVEERKGALLASGVGSIAAVPKRVEVKTAIDASAKEEAMANMGAFLKKVAGETPDDPQAVAHLIHVPDFPEPLQETMGKKVLPAIGKGLKPETGKRFVETLEQSLMVSEKCAAHFQKVFAKTTLRVDPELDAPFFDAGIPSKVKCEIVLPTGEPKKKSEAGSSGEVTPVAEPDVADMVDGFLFETCNAEMGGEYTRLEGDFFAAADRAPMSMAAFGKRKAALEAKATTKHVQLIFDIASSGGAIPPQAKRNIAQIAGTLIQQLHGKEDDALPKPPGPFAGEEEFEIIKNDPVKLEAFLATHKEFIAKALPLLDTHEELQSAVAEKMANSRHNRTITDPADPLNLKTEEVYAFQKMEIGEHQVRKILATKLRTALGKTTNDEIPDFKKINEWISARLMNFEVGKGTDKQARQQVIRDVIQEVEKFYAVPKGTFDDCFGFSEDMKVVAEARMAKMIADNSEAWEAVKDKYPVPTKGW